MSDTTKNIGFTGKPGLEFYRNEDKGSGRQALLALHLLQASVMTGLLVPKAIRYYKQCILIKKFKNRLRVVI
jgi:hypothetical protein